MSASSHPAEPRVSVVVPTHDRCGFLQEAVASVVSQTYASWELIVVDDASSDGTWEWLTSQGDSRIHTLRVEEHAERDHCRNLGLEKARGEFVMFLDDDDLLEPSALEGHVGAHASHGTVNATVMGHVVFDSEGAIHRTPQARRPLRRHVFDDVLLGWVATGGQCLMRTDVVRSIGGWDESYRVATDHELWLRFARQGPVLLLPGIGLRYRSHAGQWRPDNMADLVTGVRREAVERLPATERPRAEAVLAAREHLMQARRHFLDANASAALRHHLRALQEMPDLLRSPLWRAPLVLEILKCLGGGAGIRVGRPVLRSLRRLRGVREIQITGDVHVDNDGRWRGSPAGARDAGARGGPGEGRPQDAPAGSATQSDSRGRSERSRAAQ